MGSPVADGNTLPPQARRSALQPVENAAEIMAFFGRRFGTSNDAETFARLLTDLLAPLRAKHPEITDSQWGGVIDHGYRQYQDYRYLPEEIVANHRALTVAA